MQVSVESPTKVERRITVVIPAQRVEQAVKSELAVFAKKADVKGFRTGKVPLSIVEQRFGREVRGEAISKLIQETLTEAIRNEKLYPISTPQVETKPAASVNDLEYTATFEILPEVGTVNFNVGSLEKTTAKVGDKDVDQTVSRLREQHVNFKTVDRAAREHDKIHGKIQMFDDAQAMTPEPMPLDFILKNENSIFGWNLAEKLEGAKAGEAKRFTHVLPQDSFLQGMAGKTLEFNIEIVEVQEPEQPELNETFVKKLGVASGSLQELRDEIRKQLELNLNRSVKGLLRQKVFAKLVEQNPFEIPQSLVEREARHLHDENCQHGGGQHRHSKEDEAYFLEVAKQRIHLGLLVGEFSNKNKITASPERIHEHIAEFASVYTDPEDYIKRIKADQRGMKEIETAVLEDMVIEKLLESVSLVEKEVSYEELIKEGEAKA